VQSSRTRASINLDSISTKSGFMIFSHDRALSPPHKPVFLTNSFLFHDVFFSLFFFLSSNLLLVLKFYYIFLSILADRNSCYRARIPDGIVHFLIFRFFYFLDSFREVISSTSPHYLSHQRNALILIRLCRNANWIFRSFLQLTSKILFRSDCV